MYQHRAAVALTYQGSIPCTAHQVALGTFYSISYMSCADILHANVRSGVIHHLHRWICLLWCHLQGSAALLEKATHSKLLVRLGLLSKDKQTLIVQRVAPTGDSTGELSHL